MGYVLTADDSFAEKQVNLLTDVLGNPLRSSIRNEAYDHVVDTMADLPTPTGGPPGFINLTAGSWFFRSSLNIGNNIIIVPGAVECHLKGRWGAFLSSTAFATIAINGAALLETMAVIGDTAVLLSAVGGIGHLLECDLYGVTACVNCTVAFGYLQVTGGLWQRSAGTPSGLLIQTNVTRIQLNGVSAVGLTHLVQYVSGTVGECNIIGCNTDSANGITWGAANLPARGLSVVGNVLNGATPYNGFTQASPGANCKGNLGVAGPLSETPIVP